MKFCSVALSLLLLVGLCNMAEACLPYENKGHVWYAGYCLCDELGNPIEKELNGCHAVGNHCHPKKGEFGQM